MIKRVAKYEKCLNYLFGCFQETGFKCTLSQVTDILDNECITFRTRARQKGRQSPKKKSSPKKKTSPKKKSSKAKKDTPVWQKYAFKLNLWMNLYITLNIDTNRSYQFNSYFGSRVARLFARGPKFIRKIAWSVAGRKKTADIFWLFFLFFWAKLCVYADSFSNFCSW